jgi:hypothetical protein
MPAFTTIVLTDSIALAGHASEISNKSATIGFGANRFRQHDVKHDAEEGANRYGSYTYSLDFLS